MSYNIGDKFIIEIEKELCADPYYGEKTSVYKPLYKIKGFNALVFDENELDKLKKLDEVEETKLPESAWKYNPRELPDFTTMCPKCGASFGDHVLHYDYCPVCGRFNGRKL